MTMNKDMQQRDADVVAAIRQCASSLAQAIEINCRTCVRCMHFNADETCTLAGARPPAKVIAFGCDSFLPDDIPF